MILMIFNNKFYINIKMSNEKMHIINLFRFIIYNYINDIYRIFFCLLFFLSFYN